MITIAEMLRPTPSPLWKLVKQVGVDHVVGALTRPAESDTPFWEYDSLARAKDAYESGGFRLAVIEGSPPLNCARLGVTGRDEEIEWFCTLIRSMGRLSIPVLCYNWMAVIGWSRTHLNIPARGGALATAYDHQAMEARGLTEHGIVPEEQLWESLEYFLQRTVPVAESAGVKLAMHPDDPPLSPLRGIGRIMRSVDNFQHLLDLVPSEVNGITLCQGNFTLMTDSLPSVIRHFGGQYRIHFVHFRDVRGTPEYFEEVFHDEGPTDMLACMKAYKEIGFEGVLRPDHVPTLEGESNDDPCYANLARLHAIGYIQGLREAVYGKFNRGIGL